MTDLKVPTLTPFIEESKELYEVAMSAFVEDISSECLGQIGVRKCKKIRFSAIIE